MCYINRDKISVVFYFGEVKVFDVIFEFVFVDYYGWERRCWWEKRVVNNEYVDVFRFKICFFEEIVYGSEDN